MLDTDTKRRIDTARDILVGKVPDPKSQVEQITMALIYKFMEPVSEPMSKRSSADNRGLISFQSWGLPTKKPMKPATGYAS